MAKNSVTFTNVRENGEVIIGNNTIRSGETITLNDPEEIKIAQSCEYLEENNDGTTTNA